MQHAPIVARLELVEPAMEKLGPFLVEGIGRRPIEHECRDAVGNLEPEHG